MYILHIYRRANVDALTILTFTSTVLKASHYKYKNLKAKRQHFIPQVLKTKASAVSIR